MTGKSPDPVRLLVRSELALSREPAVPKRRQGRRSTVLRVAAVVALLGGLSGVARAQAPYRQELIPGFSSFDAGSFSSPELVDLDGDGDLDALVGEDGGRVVFFRSLAENIFADGFESGDLTAWSNF